MGHKLTAVFGHELPRMILTAGVINNNKVPFRPFLDREAANLVLPYHTTLFQWDKQQDIFYLGKMADLTFTPCTVTAEEFGIMNSKDQKQIRQQYKALTKSVKLPMVLPVRGLELFHIWDPVKRVRTITEAGNILLPD